MAKAEVERLQKNKNPELEKIRNEVLHAKGEDEKLAKNLSSQLSAIHAAYLFSGCGRSALAQICTVISSTPASSNTAATSSWKDLGFRLGLTFHQICVSIEIQGHFSWYLIIFFCINEFYKRSLILT